MTNSMPRLKMSQSSEIYKSNDSEINFSNTYNQDNPLEKSMFDL